MALDILTDLKPYLVHCDTLGSEGSAVFPRRANLLVEVKERHFSEEEIALKIQRVIPEGWGLDHFMRDHLNVPADHWLEETEWLVWNVQAAMPPFGQLTWILGVTDRDVFQGQFEQVFVADERTTVIPLHASQGIPSSIKLLELYAGGYGGWKSAVMHLAHFDIRSQVVAIEADLSASVSYALTHHANWVGATAAIDKDFFIHSKANWVLQKDVHDPNIKPAIGNWAPNMISISAPCPPWSSAGYSEGLGGRQGQLLLQSILECRWYRAPCILVEQVANFATHPHSHFIRRAFHYIGYRLVWQRTLNLIDQCSSARNRWLALAVRIHADMPVHMCQSWPIAAPEAKHSIDLALHPDQKRALMPSPEALAIASDPRKHRQGRQQGWSTAQVLEARTISKDGIFPTIMAMYGSQHLLNSQLLSTNGFLGFFLKDDTMPALCRYLHPAECALIHGSLSRCFHDGNLATAWRHQGNAIAIAHALVPLIAATNRLMHEKLEIHEVFQHYHANKLKPSECQVLAFAHGSMLCPKQTLFTTTFRTNADQLGQLLKGEKQMSYWSPQLGEIQKGSDFLQELPRCEPMSPVSQISITDTLVDTVAFQPVMQSRLAFETHEEKFWCAVDHSAATLEALWEHSMAPNFHTMDEQFALTMSPNRVDETQHEQDAIVVLQDGELTILKGIPTVPMTSQEHVSSLAKRLFDQFGQLEARQTPDDQLLITPYAICTGSLVHPTVFVAAAFEQVRVAWQWNTGTNTLSAHFAGHEVAVTMLAMEWKHAIAEESLFAIGRRPVWQPDEKILRWEPARDTGVCPPRQLRLALAIHMTRKVLTGLSQGQTDLTEEILLKWLGRPLWTGRLPMQSTMAPLFMLLQHSLTPVTGEVPNRLINNGLRMQPDFAMSQLTPSATRHKIVLHAILALKGGGGSKVQQKAMQQSALASALLEQGHELTWTTQTVDAIVDKNGLQKLQTVTAQPMGHQRIQAIYQLCKEQGIKIPEAQKPASGKPFPGAPWHQIKKRKDIMHSIDPAEFRIVPGFFMNADGTEVNQLDNIVPQASGICIRTPAQAKPWLTEAHTISNDELGLLILGALPSSTALPTQPVTFQCLNASHQKVLLHGQLVQLGAKAITCKKDEMQHMTAQPCHLVALTMYKVDYTEQDWSQLVSNPVAHAKKVFTSEGLDQSVHAYWGKSLRCNRMPASPIQATSVQLHCTVEESKLAKLLSRSGFNRIFATPKTQNGQVSTDYKVIWYPGDVTKLTAMSTKTKDCLGLVRGKQDKGYGLRFGANSFEEAWSVLHPTLPTPTLQVGDKLFKIQGLPFGCTHQMLMDWSTHTKWPVTPVRALGPQTWLVRSPQDAPEGIILFNSQPLLVRFLPPREPHQTQIILGPRSKPVAKDGKERWAGQEDPWAHYAPTSSAAAPPVARNLEGPTETRLAAQDEKIAALTENFKKLEVEHHKQAQYVQKQFEATAKREQDNLRQIQESMQNLQNSMDHNIQQTLSQQACKIDAQFGELKQLFLQRSKRRSPEEGDANME